MGRYAVLGFLVGALASIGIIVGLAYAAITSLNEYRERESRPEPVMAVRGDVITEDQIKAAEIMDRVERFAAANRK